MLIQSTIYPNQSLRVGRTEFNTTVSTLAAQGPKVNHHFRPDREIIGVDTQGNVIHKPLAVAELGQTAYRKTVFSIDHAAAILENMLKASNRIDPDDVRQVRIKEIVGKSGKTKRVIQLIIPPGDAKQADLVNALDYIVTTPNFKALSQELGIRASIPYNSITGAFHFLGSPVLTYQKDSSVGTGDPLPRRFKSRVNAMAQKVASTPTQVTNWFSTLRPTNYDIPAWAQSAERQQTKTIEQPPKPALTAFEKYYLELQQGNSLAV